jgi:hypothetical protein
MLKLTVVWEDADLIECRVEASSSAFRGEVLLYFTDDGLREFASAIAGFPRTLTDARSFETSNYDGGNGMNIALGLDAIVTLHDNEHTSQKVTLRFSVEAAAIDRFERELIHLADDRSGTAVLESARR